MSISKYILSVSQPAIFVIVGEVLLRCVNWLEVLVEKDGVTDIPSPLAVAGLDLSILKYLMVD